MPVGNRVDAFSALSLPIVATDRMLLSRSGVLSREDMSRLHGGLAVERRHPTKPVLGDFPTWVNQNAATFTDVGDAVSLAYGNGVSAGTLLAGVERALPAGNWDVTIGTKRCTNPRRNHLSGLMLRDSVSARIETLGHGSTIGNGLVYTRFTSPTVISTERRPSTEFMNPAYFRFRKTPAIEGVINYQALISMDGELWHEFNPAVAETSFFTNAPDKWGFMVHPVNSGGQNTGIRLDVFDWLETTDSDIYPDFTSYKNADGLGLRTSRITVTTDATLTDGTVPTIVNGVAGTSNATNAFKWTGGQSGRTLTFQFSEAKIIDEAKLNSSTNTSNGSWRWEGSSNGSSWTTLSANFTLAGDTTAVAIGDLTANNTAYLYYRLAQQSGTTSNTPWQRELELRIKKG